MQNKIARTLRRKRRHQCWFPAEEPFPSQAEAAALLLKLKTEEANRGQPQWLDKPRTSAL